MSKYYVIGGLLCAGGLLMIIFQAVSSMMTPGEIVWKSLSVVDVIDAAYLKWIDGISWQSIQKGFKYITTMPLYILSLSVGAFSFMVGGFVDK
jgi:hypothetical protein